MTASFTTMTSFVQIGCVKTLQLCKDFMVLYIHLRKGTKMDWLKCLGENISIAVLDSGVDRKRAEFFKSNIFFLNECTDNLGHGTAVTSILTKALPKANIYIYNLFEKTNFVDCDTLIRVLKHVTSIKHFDLIHLSCGIVECSNIASLYDTCKDITDTGTIIVSAFDNEGRVSYPAVFDNVIGVDWCRYCSKGTDYYVVEGSNVNIMGVGSLQRLPWLNGEYRYVAGSSFAAPYITSIIAKLLESGISPTNIMIELTKNAQKIIEVESNNHFPINQNFDIKKAIIFPYNKEIQTLSIYENMLPFQIEGIYDSPLFGHVGKKYSEIVQSANFDNDHVIKSITDIVWTNDFDTVILGHVDVISSALKKDFIRYFIEKCVENKKNLYAFDDLTTYAMDTNAILENGNSIFSPNTSFSCVDKGMMGKLYGISTPVIAVFGTSSKQGKFSLQLKLRQKMQKIGYKVGGLGTEPTSLLFGFDRVYPIGYGGIGPLGSNAIQIINRYMHEIDCKGNDIIIVGSQSQTIPYNYGNIGHYPLSQHEFLLGTTPDAILLCINPFDELEYVKRTICYLESYVEAKVIALVVFSKHRELEWAIQGTPYQTLPKEQLQERSLFYEKKLEIPCYMSNCDQDIDRLIDCVTDYFAEES